MQDAPAGQQPGRIADSSIVADMSDPLSPPVVTSSGSKELPAYVSNGLIGLRVVDIPIDSVIEDESTGQRSTAPQPTTRKKGRAAMPSWDEIVFGARARAARSRAGP